MSQLSVGMKVKYLPQPEWGVGHLLSLEDNNTKAQVSFPARDAGAPILVTTRGGTLVHAVLNQGDAVRTKAGLGGVVTASEPVARGLYFYSVKLEDGTETELIELDVRALEAKFLRALRIVKHAGGAD